MCADYYKELGVDANASKDAIRKAYKKLALKWHPDKNPDNRERAEERFKRIAKAYEVLGDDQKRKRYDLSGTDEESGYQPGRGAGGSFNMPYMRAQDIFNQFFGGRDPFEDLFSDPFIGSSRHGGFGRSRTTIGHSFMGDDMFGPGIGSGSFMRDMGMGGFMSMSMPGNKRFGDGFSSSFTSTSIDLNNRGGAVSSSVSQSSVTLPDGRVLHKKKTTKTFPDGRKEVEETEEVEDKNKRSNRRALGGNGSRSNSGPFLSNW